jgi:DNA-directed RNA polymerase specialized sigma24 family protein
LCFVTGDRNEAEEIMQDVFLRFDDPSAYLFRTAMNVFRKRYRRSVLGLRRTLSIDRSDDAFSNVDDRDLIVRTPSTRSSCTRTPTTTCSGS